MGQTKHKPAGFFRRFAAAIVDLVLVYIATAFVVYLHAVSQRSVVRPEPLWSTELFRVFEIEFFCAAIIPWLYFAVLESSFLRSTIGKMSFNIFVVDLEGERITFFRATGRHFGKILSALPLGIGFFMAGFTEKKQAFHDKLANTLVVVKEKKRK